MLMLYFCICRRTISAVDILQGRKTERCSICALTPFVQLEGLVYIVTVAPQGIQTPSYSTPLTHLFFRLSPHLPHFPSHFPSINLLSPTIFSPYQNTHLRAYFTLPSPLKSLSNRHSWPRQTILMIFSRFCRGPDSSSFYRYRSIPRKIK